MSHFSFGIVECSGVDAGKFLQGQLSADILSLTERQGALACYLNLKGRVVALMFVIKKPEGFWLIMPQDTVPILIERLQKFIVFSKATLKDISGEYAIEGLLSSPSHHPAYHVEGNVFDVSPEYGIQLHIDHKPSPAALSSEFLLALMKAHIPWIGLTQSEQFLPHYINLVALKAVSFKKGCYVGQEIVARMQYKGHLNKTLAMIELIDNQPMDIVNEIDYLGRKYVLIIN